MSDAVVIALIGGSAGIISAIVSAYLSISKTLKENKAKALDECLSPINKKLDAIYIDVTRMRLLDLIRFEPKDGENILKIAKVYFKDLNGDSEASNQFESWLDKTKCKCPDWYTKKGAKK